MSRIATAVCLLLAVGAANARDIFASSDCMTWQRAIKACKDEGAECCDFVGKFFRAGCYCPRKCINEKGKFDVALQELMMIEAGLDKSYHTCRKLAPTEFDIPSMAQPEVTEMKTGSLPVGYEGNQPGAAMSSKSQPATSSMDGSWGMSSMLDSLYDFLLLPFTYSEPTVSHELAGPVAGESKDDAAGSKFEKISLEELLAAYADDYEDAYYDALLAGFDLKPTIPATPATTAEDKPNAEADKQQNQEQEAQRPRKVNSLPDPLEMYYYEDGEEAAWAAEVAAAVQRNQKGKVVAASSSSSSAPKKEETRADVNRRMQQEEVDAAWAAFDAELALEALQAEAAAAAAAGEPQEKRLQQQDKKPAPQEPTPIVWPEYYDDDDMYDDMLASAFMALAQSGKQQQEQQLAKKQADSDAALWSLGKVLETDASSRVAAAAAAAEEAERSVSASRATDSDAELEEAAAAMMGDLYGAATAEGAADWLLDPSYKPAAVKQPAAASTDAFIKALDGEDDVLHRLAGLFGGSEHYKPHSADNAKPAGWEALDKDAQQPAAAQAAAAAAAAPKVLPSDTMAMDWDESLEEDLWAWLNGPAHQQQAAAGGQDQGAAHHEARMLEEAEQQPVVVDGAAWEDAADAVLSGYMDRYAQQRQEQEVAIASARAFGIPRVRSPLPSAQAALDWVCANYWNILLVLSAFNFVGFAIMMARLYYLESRYTKEQQQQQQQQPEVRDMDIVDLSVDTTANPCYTSEVRAFMADMRSALQAAAPAALTRAQGSQARRSDEAALRVPLLSSQQ